jgi:hypothetical protein
MAVPDAVLANEGVVTCMIWHIVSCFGIRHMETFAPMEKTESVSNNLTWLTETGWLKPGELSVVQRLFTSEFPFAEAVRLAESIHLHLKVQDTDALPVDDFRQHGANRESGKSGYRKFFFPDGLNLICSTIPIAQDDLAEAPETMRLRPFLDHIGIDLREENESVRACFRALAQESEQMGWGHIPQGGKGRPVYCCHMEVAEKRWVYPSGEVPEDAIPLEFSFGPLKINDFLSGCDLRPSSPVASSAA